MLLFFDTETTGLPRNWKASVSDLDNWPRMIQIAWLQFDEDGNQTGGKDFIIKPDGFIIPPEASSIHGITTERALRDGAVLKDVLNEFQGLVSQAGLLVAHNMSFDEKIVGAEFLRNDQPDVIASKKKICTMLSSTDFCKIEGPYGYKWPKLSELYFKLFGTALKEAHNAAIDIQATAMCFWQMKKLGVIK